MVRLDLSLLNALVGVKIVRYRLHMLESLHRRVALALTDTTSLEGLRIKHVQEVRPLLQSTVYAVVRVIRCL